MDKIKTFAKFFLGFPLSIISIYFIFKFIANEWPQVSSHLFSLNPVGAVLGVFFLFLFFLFRSLTWNSLLETEGYEVPPVYATYLLSVSEIKRYIPGSVLGFLSRVNNFGEFKIPAKKVVQLIFYESIIFLLTSIALSIPSLIMLAQRIRLNYLEIAAALLVLLTFFIVLIFSVLKIKKTITVKNVFLNLKKYKKSVIFMMVAWILFGIGNYLVGASLNYLDPSKIFEFSSLFILSWLAGYLILIAPLGLGVREGAVTYGLSFFMPVPLAAAIAILSRLALVLSEILFLTVAFFFNKFGKLPKRIDYHLVLLWGAIVSYIAYFSYVSFEKYNNFFSGRFDLGNMDQTVWNTIHGRIFELTNPDSTQIVSRLAFHADFMLILLSPLYLIWGDPRMLLLVQSVTLGLGAFFVYKIGTKILDDKTLSLIFSISYLLNPWVQKQNLFDFHAVTLATTFFLASFYFILEKKYLPSFIFIVLSALTKEEAWVIAGLMSLYVYFKTKQKEWLLFSLVSFSSFYFLITKIIPSFRGGSHFAISYFKDFGDSPPEIIKNIVFRPTKTGSTIFTLSNFTYVFKLLLPVGFLSVLAPLALIFALPDFFINIFSNNENLKSLTFHYAAAIIPFIYISAIYGVKVLHLRMNKSAFKLIGIYFLASSVVATFFLGTLPGSLHSSIEIYNNSLANRDKIEKYLSQIPARLSVSASNNLGSHLSHRENIYTIPSGVESADVVVFLLNDEFAQPSLKEQKSMAQMLKNNPSYTELFQVDDFIAFSKKSVAKYIKSDRF